MRFAVFSCIVLAVALADAKRGGGGGGRRGGSTSSTSFKHRTPAPPRVDHSSSNTFLNNERGSSFGGSNTHNRGNPFDKPSAPHPPKPPPVQTNGPIGFEKVNGANNHQGPTKLGFDKVNSEAQHPSTNSHTPSAPPYPGAPNGPPPPYGTHPGNSYSGLGDHPPPYSGRPVNAPPAYSPNNQFNGQANPSQPGFGNSYPVQHGNHQGQSFPSQPSYNNYGNTYPQPNQFGQGHGTYPSGGSSYPVNGGFSPGYGSNSFGGNYPHNTPYQGNAFGGSPFGSSGYNGNSNYNPNNFGYSNNPGYFGSQGGYSGFPGQYDSYHKKSRFRGLPIPIPIPIPIPLGGGFGGSGIFGGLGSHSYNHRVLNTFVKNHTNVPSGNSTTSIFMLNNSTVTPCTTDHFVYDLLKVSVLSCTAEHCTAIKVFTTTNISSVVSVHSAGITMCLEKNSTISSFGDNVTPTVSELRRDNLTVCRNVSDNSTAKANETAKTEELSTTVSTLTDITSTDVATTTSTTESPVASNTTTVCESVECFSVEMCMPAIEVLDNCTAGDCPFKRTGFKPCVTIKTCRSPSVPISTFATINTTISKIDEYNNHNSVYDAANLTLISYHRPVINFNCPQNGTAPGCPPPTGPSTKPAQTACLPGQTSCDSTTSTTANSTVDAVQTTTLLSDTTPIR